MSRRIARSLAALVRGLTAPMSRYAKLKTRLMVAENLVQVIDVGGMKFHSPTARSTHDTNSLLDDGEPETIRWLDSLPAGSVLWDIGANVGAFTVYAAIRCGLRVVAFEPGAASFATLTRNIELNGLDGRADAYCMALADVTKLDYLYMADTGPGHSMHAFGSAETVDGTITAAFRQAVPGMTADRFATLFDAPKPDHIKLDVDSIELAVLKGATGLLNDSVSSVLVEVAGHSDGDDIREFLGNLGFQEIADTTGMPNRNAVFRKQNVVADA